MPITPNDPADFTPTRGSYKELSPFRFWCQKVLPLVYDDSLSYYELLNKVVNYLNMAMEDVTTLEGDVTNLHTAYVQLQTYVNDYFVSLDVQEEIDTKLDEMAESGALSELLEPFIPSLVSKWLEDNINPTTPAIDSSLSVSGAGADSLVTGNIVRSIKNDIALSENGLQTLESFGEWYNAGLYWTDASHVALKLDTNKRHQVASIQNIVFDRPVTFFIDADYRVILMEYVNGLYYDRGYKTGSFTVQANVPFCIAIDKTNSTAVSNIPVFLKAVKFTTLNRSKIDTMLDAPLIAENTDLNTLLTSGFYRVNANAVNAPSNWDNRYPSYIQTIKTKDALYTVQIFTNILDGKVYWRYYGGSPATWNSWANIYDKSKVDYMLDAPIIPTNSNLNEYRTSGIYRVNTGATPVPDTWDNNAPTYLIVTKTKDGAYTTQMFLDMFHCIFHWRYYGGSPLAWSDWTLIYDKRVLDTLHDITFISVGADLNDIKDGGTYRVNNNPVNGPSGWSVGAPTYLDVLKTKNALYTVQILSDLQNQKYYWRFYGGSPLAWSDWILIYEKSLLEDATTKNNKVNLYNGITFNAPSAENVGTPLTVLSYNVAHYNNDTSVYMTDEKRHNFKNMLSEINADFVCLQEADANIDGTNGTKNSMSYLFYPVYPYTVGTGNTQIISRRNFTSFGQVRDSMDRVVRYGLYTINNETLLVCCIHAISRHGNTITEPIDSEASIADRLVEYNDIIGWVSGTKTLPDYYSGSAVSVPAHKWLIVCGDFNTVTNADKTNLLSICNANNIKYANGSWLDWLESNRNASGSVILSVDNILCNSNVSINSITAHAKMYKDLYSDHYPFSVKVTLI